MTMIIGVGCDIVEIERIDQARTKEGFLKILTQEEMLLYTSLPETRKSEWLAGRFAAKEAIIKAMSSKAHLLLSQISIVYKEKKPYCDIEGVTLHLSIAHENHYAIAYAIAEEG